MYADETGNKQVSHQHVDLSDWQSIRSLTQRIFDSEIRLDVLINNAGIVIHAVELLSSLEWSKWGGLNYLSIVHRPITKMHEILWYKPCLSKRHWRSPTCQRCYARSSDGPSAVAAERTRNSSGDEIANVNFLYDDIVYTRSKNTIDSCINSATDRFLQHRFTKFREITQCNGHYAVQGHSRSPISVPIESSYTTSY